MHANKTCPLYSSVWDLFLLSAWQLAAGGYIHGRGALQCIVVYEYMSHAGSLALYS